MKVDEGSYFNIQINAMGGWNINTVTYNGEDVTNQLDETNSYNTPYILENSFLNVSLERILTSVDLSKYGEISVYGNNSQIIINGAESGKNILVYNESGSQITSIIARDKIISLSVNAGIYIVKIEDRIFKIAVF